jgi:uncharacterized membrane protein YdbT with pleckstrin-like domain
MPDVYVSKEKGKKEVEVMGPDELPRGRARHKIYGHSHSPIAAFAYYPDRVKFVAADKEEKIVLLLRKHPITNLKWILVAALMILAPTLASFMLPVASLPENFQLIMMMGWYLIVLAYIIEQFLDWYFNVNIVTDERIFDVDFVNLIYREITDANIDQIQDVTVQMGGVLGTTFNYGNVVIQTAAEIPQIEFTAVPKPDAVAQILRELRVEEEQEKLEGRVR